MLGPVRRLRLRSKLLLSLMGAVLVTSILVATIGVWVILPSLERGLRDDATQQARIGRGLVDRAVRHLAIEAEHWALSTELLTAVTSRAALLVAGAAALTELVDLHRTASTIDAAVGRIQRLVGALKSYSHLDQHEGRVVANLHDGVETTLTLLEHALRDIPVERVFGAVPDVAISVDELNQVWTNLIQNAVHAAGPGGTIRIATTIVDGDAVLRVSDSGAGIPGENLRLIFEPFYTTKAKAKAKGEGTGLDLGIVRQIVDKHGGRIPCESQPGRTCFTVTLPLSIAGQP